MRTKLITITLLALGLFFLALLSASAEDIIDSGIPGLVQGTGTYFEITDSEYLNISLQSSQEITVLLESMPNIISLNIEASSISSSTTLTISGLEPNRTYYQYDNSYKNEVEFVSDGNGSYNWTQDLTQPHHIWFQETRGTIFIPEDCTTYGIWDEPTSTCTLTQDLNEGVEITTDGVTLDCDNHSITGVSNVYGIYINNRAGTTIKNCTVTNFYSGIYLVYSFNNTIIDNTIFGNNRGIYAAYNNQYNQPVIETNSFYLNSYPVWVHDSYPQFLNNSISGNNWDGIVLKGIEIEQDYTLSASVPFINYESIPSWSIVVLQGHTLTLEPGTIIKSVAGTSGLTIEGTLIAEGTETQPIVFTTIYDDEYGGDTNGDGDATIGNVKPGIWGQLVFNSTSINSSLDNVIIRYGGRKWMQAPIHSVEEYILKAVGSDLTLSDSIIEHNTSGVYLENSSSQISNVTFKDHEYTRQWWDPISTGLSLESSNPQIRNSTFQSNHRGIYMGNNSEPVIEDNIFSGNDRPIWVYSSYPQFLGNNQITGNNMDGVILKGIVLNRDYTLGGGPVFVNYDSSPSSGIIVPNGYTLTIEPGTIIKFIWTSAITVHGTLIANGTVGNPIVFTSLYDDEYGGDTNGDGGTTSPQAGSWGQIVLTPTSTNSSLDNVVIRYGGKKWATAPIHSIEDYTLKITDSDLTLSNSIIENNVFGFYMENSNSPITRTTFKDHQYTKPFWWHDSTGLKLISSNPAIDYSIFSNNKRGIDVVSGSATLRNSSFYANNNYGIYNSGLETVDAIQNWWGDPSGPYHPALNPDGLGDRVSDQVNFEPWLGYDPTINQPPTFSDAGQYKSDESTVIFEGGITTESTVVFKAIVSDPDNDRVKLQVELKEYEQDFDEQNIIESNLVDSGSEAIITRPGLIKGQYKWRARAVDENGAISGDWEEFGMVGNVDFEVQLVPLYTQVVSPYPSIEETESWADLDYAEGSVGNYDCGSKIYQCGCAITSTVMILRFYDITVAEDNNDVNPLTFNNWLTANNGYNAGDLDWDKIDDYSREPQTNIKRLHYVGPVNFKDNNTLDNYLANLQPTILKVYPIVQGVAIPHFIVADGQLTDTYTIKDPAWYNTRHLTQTPDSYVYNYNDNFSQLRLFSPTIAIRGVLHIHLASPAELLVADPLGRKLGRDPIVNVEYNEIPEGVYYLEGIGNPFAEIPTPVEESKNIWIPDPVDGEYNVQVIGTDPGTYTLDFSVYNEAGKSTDETFEAIIAPDVVSDYSVNYNSTAEEPAEIERVVTISDAIEDVKVSYGLGWITKKWVKKILIAKLKIAQRLEQQKQKKLERFDKLIEKAKNPKVKKRLERAKERYEKRMDKTITKILKLFIKKVKFYNRKSYLNNQAKELLIDDAQYIIEHL